MRTSFLLLCRAVAEQPRPSFRLSGRSGATLSLLALLAFIGGCSPGGEPASSDAFVRAMNTGKAHLENKESADAVQAFTTAADLQSDSAAAWRNLARAQLLARDNDAAAAALQRAAAIESDSAANNYLLGLTESRQSRFAEAVEHFEKAVQLDPDTAALRFQLAGAYQTLKRHDEAIEQLEATVLIDPLHVAAYYKLSSYARLSGDRAALAKWQREWQRLRAIFGDESRTPELLENCIYTLSETVDQDPPAAPMIAFEFVDATGELFGETTSPVNSAVVLDVDETGVTTLATLVEDGGVRLLASGGEAGQTAGLEASSVDVVLAGGNFQDPVPEGTTYQPALHAREDLLLLSQNEARLLLREEGGFVDVTSTAGFDDLAGRRARWTDIDHDGDLDLLVARDEGLQVWQNGGDGRFSDVTAEVGIAETGVVDIVAVDLDRDVAVDLVVARGDSPTLVYENQRTGSFAKRPDPPGPWPAAHRVLADDLDNDGHPDVVLVGGSEAVMIYGNGERQRLELDGATTGVLVDVDNDGRLDFAAGNDQGLRLWRNATDGWQEIGADVGLSAFTAKVRDLVAADLDGDGDSDLAVVTAEGLRGLRNDGGEANGQLKVRLHGTKTNPGGVGTRVEVRSGDFVAVRQVVGPVIEVGLGGRTELDSVLTVWTNGVVDNEIGVTIGSAPMTIAEKNVATGSCPFLYAWNGEEFAFVTDLLGNSPLGLSLRRGVPLAADPDEYVEIGGPSSLGARDGTYVLQVTEEMREVLYLDHAELVAVDHPPDVEIHPTDKLMPPPFPASELWALGAPRPLRSASADGVHADGDELNEILSTIDGRFASPGELMPPPLRGVVRPRELTLDFGPLDTARPLVLALTGWLQYGDASTNIAISQHSTEIAQPPVLEVESGGGWRPVDVTVGVPAGKTKTILVDLAGRLPADSRRLRLTTALEIRWDRIALFDRLPDATAVHRRALPVRANLQWRGFSDIRSRAPGHPTTPVFADVSSRPPWRTTLQGWMTRYGDVLPLVNSRDERLALVGAGDAVELAFDATVWPSPAPGMERTFFFYSVGWDKDGDHNVIDGDTVEPLPVSAGNEWRIEYNTRWVPEHFFGEQQEARSSSTVLAASREPHSGP